MTGVERPPTSRRGLFIVIAAVVVIGAGTMWYFALSSPPAPTALTSGTHWRLLYSDRTSKSPGTLTATADSAGLLVHLVSNGAKGNCSTPTLRSVEDRNGRALVRLQWEGKGCADDHRGEAFEMRFTDPVPTVITFELVDSCARWDLRDPTHLARLAGPHQDDAGNCPL